MAKNYYIILGLSNNATRDDIQAAYRRLAKQYHPDHYGENSEPFLQIQEAYDVLNDPDARRKYDDSFRHARRELFRDVTNEKLNRNFEVKPMEPMYDGTHEVFLTRSFNTYTPSFDEIFDRLWSNFSGMRQTKADTRQPLTAEITLSPDQARTGGQMHIYVPAHTACPTCKGRGGTGFYECWRCAGQGSISGEFPVVIEYAPGITDGHTTMISLNKFGIRNTYLTIRFRITY